MSQQQEKTYIEVSNSNHTIDSVKIKIGLLSLSNRHYCFDKYEMSDYLYDVNSYGLEDTWAHILNYVKQYGENEFLNSQNFGKLYEAGLAELDKNKKKKSGQYYTPRDVSKLMASWLLELEGSNICDVGCGTGNLIMAYLELLPKDNVESLLKNKKIYLYDFDKVALTIAQFTIAMRYGIQYLQNINTIYGDFLSTNIVLPNDSKVISNPPYANYDEIDYGWECTNIQKDTKELYACFMEKIIASNCKAVIITPYSFLGGTKFYSLRKLMSSHNGFIVAFDNVPGNIFNGKKQGIFNTNTANSVRAAITVVENKPNQIGFRTTHLIRFKNEEREKLLNSHLLKSYLSNNSQIVNSNHPMFAKCFVDLENCFEAWIKSSHIKMRQFISKEPTNYILYMPNTCRYYTTASKRKLSRGGYLTLYVDDEDKFNFLYCLINSSFVYWWWRIYDGGITYPRGLFLSIPIFYDQLSADDKKFFNSISAEMIQNESNYIITKANAGTIQENIKFPKKYRDIINKRILKILKCENDCCLFDSIHSNTFFDKIEESKNED